MSVDDSAVVSAELSSDFNANSTSFFCDFFSNLLFFLPILVTYQYITGQLHHLHH